MKELKFVISKDGESVSIDAKGFSNKQCLTETKEIENALGMVSKRKMKRDNPNYIRQSNK